MDGQATSSLIHDVNAVLKLPEDKDIDMLVQSNMPPTNSAQRRALTEMITERESVIQRLDSAANGGQDPRGLYRYASLFLSAQVQSFKSILSPVREVPVEILAQIFEMVIFAFYHPSRRQVLSLTQVCSRWRNICHSTSRLWKVYRWDVSECAPGKDFDLALDAELTSAWFQHAAPHPVQVRLYAHNCPASSSIPLMSIIPHAIGIAVLDLTVSDAAFPSIPEHLLATLSFPILRKLEVVMRYDGEPIPREDIDPIFPFLSRLHAPQLTDVYLDLQDTLPDLQRYGHQLRRLTLSLKSYAHSDLVAPATGNVLAVLQYCTQLENLDVILSCRGLEHFSGSIRLERLKYLSVDLAEDGFEIDYMHLFSVLILPGLEGLDVVFPTDHVWDWSGWMSFKHRSGLRRLRRISFSRVEYASADRLWAFLLGIDSIEELHLGEYGDGLEFLHHFLTFDPLRPFLPNLHSLDIMAWVDQADRTPQLDELIERIVRSRWWSGTATKPYRRWTDVCIVRDTCGGFLDLEADDDGELLSPQARERMKGIAAEGLSLDFESRNF
ncbi:hypothetical protein V5O48_003306 [Marasmius crinis-equi]|uniref:F-box domain-containing protein n=1 Tax=Marasmius crinis-equi TaxID=585013 RepID=A0ABR3FT92_9AGAR